MIIEITLEEIFKAVLLGLLAYAAIVAIRATEKLFYKDFGIEK